MSHPLADFHAFVAGYFDAEGGIPHDPQARFYVQFVQKDRRDLTVVRETPEGLGVTCGVLHVPSKRVDPDYWRFFVRSCGFDRFLEVIRPWHPAKRLRFEDRKRARLAFRAGWPR